MSEEARSFQGTILRNMVQGALRDPSLICAFKKKEVFCEEIRKYLELGLRRVNIRATRVVAQWKNLTHTHLHLTICISSYEEGECVEHFDVEQHSVHTGALRTTSAYKIQ